MFGSSRQQAKMEFLADIAQQPEQKRIQANGYSALWQKNPEVLRNQALPEGFVGFCSRCGKPGHLNHPLGASSTDVWCECCYPVIARRIWLKQVALFGIAVGVLWGLKYILL